MELSFIVYKKIKKLRLNQKCQFKNYAPCTDTWRANGLLLTTVNSFSQLVTSVILFNAKEKGIKVLVDMLVSSIELSSK